MNVEATEWRKGQHLRRDHQAVRSHHQDIGMPARDLRPGILTSERGRLCERQLAGNGRNFHGARRQAPAASARPIRLRQNADDLVMALQRRQSWQREFRCAREGDAQH